MSHNGSAFFQPVPYEPSPVSLMFRQSCSRCGSSALDWMHSSDLVTRVPVELRTEVSDFLGDVCGDAWVCCSCAHFGLLPHDLD